MCWDYRYVVLIFATTLINYISGLQIAKTKSKVKKKVYLVTGLTTSLGILFFFKYFNFFSESVNAVLDNINVFYEVPVYNLLLPVGISFYTFQTLSYTIDVYKGEKSPEPHFGIFALYVSFFPQLVAGPIERSTNLLPQFFKKVEFSYDRIRDGIYLMAWGFFKKVVIADRLSEYVNTVYNDPSAYGSGTIVIGTIFFAFQIYCDFSGYSDIAIGSAKVLGFDLMKNFNRPYLAKNIREFWQRWHISLSSWFRDYLYIPLGGNRVAKWRWWYNLFITFLISGLWHGANWTFVVWGGLHGLYQVFEIWTSKSRIALKEKVAPVISFQLYKALEIAITVFLAWFAWIFFRANTISDAFIVVKRIFVFNPSEKINLFYFKSDMVLSIILIGLLFFIEVLEERIGLWNKLQSLHKFYKWAMLVLIILSIFILGKWNDVDFLYFQF